MPNGQLPAYLAGQNAVVSLLQSAVPLVAYKLGDTARASTIVPVADPDLTVPLAVNAFYAVACLLIYTGGTNNASDLEVTPTAAGATLSWWTAAGRDAAALAPLLGTAQTGFALGSNGAGSNRAALIFGSVITGAAVTAATITWSQNTSNATATTVKAGSWLMAWRMA